MMKNVTISLEEELYSATRIDAAKAGKSMSRYIADCLREAAKEEDAAERTRRRLEALQRIFDGPMWDVTENGRMPTAEERNARR